MARYTSARIGLNRMNPGNSGFFCQTNRMHLTRDNAMGVIYTVTLGIISELVGHNPNLIDIDRVIDIKNKCFKEIPEPEMNKEPEVEEPEPEIMNVIDASEMPVFEEPVLIPAEVVEEVIPEPEAPVVRRTRTR